MNTVYTDDDVVVFQTGRYLTEHGQIVAAKLLPDCRIQIYDAGAFVSGLLVERIRPEEFCASRVAELYFRRGADVSGWSTEVDRELRAAVAESRDALSIRREVNR